MPHSTYGPPHHQLETVTIKVTLPQRRNGYQTSLTAHGEASGKRAPLWTIREQWGADEIERGLQAGDAVAHLLLTALQDRPNCQSGMEASLIGEGWEDVPLPF